MGPAKYSNFFDFSPQSSATISPVPSGPVAREIMDDAVDRYGGDSDGNVGHSFEEE